MAAVSLTFLKQSACACQEGANEFIRTHFCDCIYNTKDAIAFSIGLSSIVIWLLAQIPQLMENYRNKKAEALSIWFLVDWLMGDACNLIGCLASGDQLATQVYTAVYFVLMDMVVLLQYTYYNALNSRIAREHRHKQRHQQRADGPSGTGSDGLGRYQPLPAAGSSQTAPAAEEIAQDGEEGWGQRRPDAVNDSGASTRLLACVGGGLLMATFMSSAAHAGDPNMGSHARAGRVLQGLFSSNLEHDFGIAIGYVSSVFYVKGRISQIIRNCRRRTTEGLSALMFVNAILGNVTYGVAIFMRLESPDDLLDKMPWLIGSLGTVFLDFTILLQELSSNMHKRQASSSAAAAIHV